MMWLQIFALVVLVGYHRACGHEYDDDSDVLMQSSAYSVHKNSFPYHYITNNRYTSAIVSFSSGPLCSGLHVDMGTILTVASCVFRNTAEDLFVMTKANNASRIYLHEYLMVYKIIIHPLYDVATGKYNIAILSVVPPLSPVPILKLPSLSSSATEGTSQVHINRFSYDETKKVFVSHLSPVEAKLNLNECSEDYGDIEENLYYCVNLVDKVPYSYGMLDLGTSLIYSHRNNEYIMGLFTATYYPSFNTYKIYYLYQSILPLQEFITAHMRGDKRSDEIDYQY